VTNELNPSGDCLGPSMRGCPHGAKAEIAGRHESSAGVTVEWRGYHCAACLEIYKRRYG
jgi:hypothetical protein